MIYPRSYKTKPTLGAPNPKKSEILSFMKSFEPYDCAEGYALDYKTGTRTKRAFPDGYRHEDLAWTGEDTYNFEFNDMELSSEFCAKVLELIGQA